MPRVHRTFDSILSILVGVASGATTVQEAGDQLIALHAGAQATATALCRDVAAALVEMESEGEIAQEDSRAILGRLASDSPEPRHHFGKLKEVVQAAAGSKPLTERLTHVSHLVTDATGMDACTLFLLDDATHTLALRAATGMDPSTVGAVTLRVEQGIVGRAAREWQTIAASHATEHEDYLNHPGLTDERFSSQLSSPLIVTEQQRLVGVISVHALETKEFSKDDIEFLETIAGMLAVSIDSSRQSARTDDRLQQKIVELTTLQRVSRVVASSLNLTEVLKLITEQAVELVQAEAAAIFRASRDLQPSEEPRPSIEYRVGVIRSHENERERDFVVRDVLRTGVARTRDIAYRDGMSTVFCLPLNTARETVGSLCFRMRQGTALDEEQLGLLQAFGDAAALAIDNAQLYQEAVESVRTQSALVQEMHHRVRNNLQTVAALLSLQQRAEEGNPWSPELGEAVSRIQAIAGVHDLMSDESRLAGTTVDALARMVAEEAHGTLTPPDLRVEFEIEKSNLRVPSRQATIIALLINELTANAIHHGFRSRSRGKIRISAREVQGVAVLQVANDGEQISPDFDPMRSRGLGMRITKQLVTSDLHGEFTIMPTVEGTLATIRFPITKLTQDELGQSLAGS
ncbi:MAG TPA: GAF domain-containing protein [Thermomicrobiales bacterium]|nr:GAF domain-containing protein [Thermomicrobiales bacterium]